MILEKIYLMLEKVLRLILCLLKWRENKAFIFKWKYDSNMCQNMLPNFKKM
jgi:hypothetical protein